MSLGTGGLLLGGYPAAGGYGFNGLLDEAAIYGQALTATQVAAHYAQRLPQAWIRAFVIVVGTAMTIYFFVRIVVRGVADSCATPARLAAN